jgi:hypothetical protein
VNVAALQKHIHDLGRFVSDAGGNKAVVDGLESVRRGLEPFAAYKFEDFAAFLKVALEIADEFKRTGQVPIPPSRRKGSGGATRRPAAAKMTVEEAAARVRSLYDSAPKPDFSPDAMEAELKCLEGLSLADLKTVAAQADSAGKVKSARAKKAVLDAIRGAIRDRRGNVERVEQ